MNGKLLDAGRRMCGSLDDDFRPGPRHRPEQPMGDCGLRLHSRIFPGMSDDLSLKYSRCTM